MTSIVVILSLTISFSSCSFWSSTVGNSTPRKDDLALIQAVDAGQSSLVEAALKAGANPNAMDAEGESALIVAVEVGQAGLVEVLLEAGADVNAVDVDGESALIVRGRRWSGGFGGSAA